MPFRTQYIQIDGSLNIDGSLFLWQVPFTGGAVDVSSLSIESWVNSSSYYDASLTYWNLPNPSSYSNSITAQGYFVQFTAGATIATDNVIYCLPTGRVSIADSDASTTMPCIAFYVTTTGSGTTSGTSYNFLTLGSIKNAGFPAMTIGKQAVVSGLGEPTTTIPTGSADCIQVIGVAASPYSLIARPSPNFIQLK